MRRSDGGGNNLRRNHFMQIFPDIIAETGGRRKWDGDKTIQAANYKEYGGKKA